MEDTPHLAGPDLGATEKRRWRFAIAFAAAILVLLAYALPFFADRITEAVTRYSGGTSVTRYFSVLIHEQHLLEGKRPTGEEFWDVAITVEPIRGYNSSAWGWLLHLVSSNRPFQFASLIICLVLPIVSVVITLLMIAMSWIGRQGLPERLIAPSINLAFLSVPALLLTWLHQFDFSGRLLARGGADLWPGVGFWVALGASTIMAVALLGLRHETRRRIVSWWALVVLVAVFIWLLTRFRPYPYLDIWNFISDGILITLRITTTSFGLILLVSLLGGLGRISKSPIIHGLSTLYVEIIRGIPLLVQLLFIWFALPQVLDVIGATLANLSPSLADFGQRLIDLRLNPFTAAVLGLTICYGAYGSEIFRAGISSIHHGQMEAARSLGMTYIQAMRYVILPQAIRVILPPVGNEFVALLKDSSLVSVLAVSDLTRRGREYMARTFLSFDTWIMVALCYLVLTLFSSRVVESIEARSSVER